MDVPVHALLRLLQLGQSQRVLESKTAWLCSSCVACTARCPQEIDPHAVLSAIQVVVARSGKEAPVPGVLRFNRTFLRGIKATGRIFEPAFVFLVNLGARRPFRDLGLAWRLLQRGRLRWYPARATAARARRLLRRVEQVERQR